jgi:hypothetical protein
MNQSRQHFRRIGSEPTEEAGQDSEIDENAEIFELEMRDFDDVDGIDADVD